MPHPHHFSLRGPSARLFVLDHEASAGQNSGNAIAGTGSDVDRGKLAVLRQTALGLAAIHAAGIIHRDIKSNNIMVDGRLRIAPVDHRFRTGPRLRNRNHHFGKLTIAGTPGYIAPEFFLGHPPSQASDLFALGVVLHEVFTGEKPTPRRTVPYLVSRELTTPVPPFSVA